VYDNTTKTLIFSRDDNSTFSVDASMFFDDTNLVISINGYTGTVNLTKEDVQLGLADNTADIDKNVNSALTLTTPRNITLSGDISGTVSFDGSVNVDLAVTVADDSHNHIIANIDGLQDALDYKLDYGTYVRTTSEQALDPFTPFEAGVNELVLNRGDGFANRVQVKTVGGNTILGSGNIDIDSFINLDEYYNKTEVDNLFQASLITVSSSSVSDGNVTFEKYAHPASHNIGFIDGLQTALDNKVDITQVQTAVPAGAVFTDTTYTDLNEFTNTPGYISNYTVTEADVTAHQAAINITESQISDFGTYLTPTGDGSGLTGIVSGLTNSVVSSALTAVNGNRYFADTSTAAFTITLPATPVVGTRLIIHDVTGNFATNNLTVDRNGETILGLAENLILDVNNDTTELIYINNDWRIM
jgi:hypothetical protein